MALLVQTPRGTIAIPPQGFFQQQPSPFENSIGLLTSQPPRQFEPRLPAPVDIDSASAVQPSSPTPPRRVIPRSSNSDLARRLPDEPEPLPPTSFNIAIDRDNANPFAAPIDPANVFGAVGFLSGVPGASLVGRSVGNLAAYAQEPPAIQDQISGLQAFFNSITPFGMFGRSVESQARDIARDFERTIVEDALSFTDFPNPAFEPFFDPIINMARPDEEDAPGPGPAASGPGSSADPGPGGLGIGGYGGIGGVPGMDDTSDAPDSGPSGGGGGGGGGGSGGGSGGSYICTAAWDTGISAPETWSLNRRFGVWIRRNDPLAYEGYSVFGPWIADRIRDGKLRWIGKLKPQCWAYEMAQRSGKDTSGYSLGVKILNRVQRVTTRPLIRLLGLYVRK